LEKRTKVASGSVDRGGRGAERMQAPGREGMGGRVLAGRPVGAPAALRPVCQPKVRAAPRAGRRFKLRASVAGSEIVANV